MALEGTLQDFGLPDIFQLIGQQTKTGVLTLKSEGATVRVYFRDGKVINAEGMSKGGEDRIGTVLVRRGRISEEQLQDALKTQRDTLQQLGHILVSRRYVSPEELADSLRMQATQIIFKLFRWREGLYHFDQDADVAAADGPFEPLTSEGILMEGVRMLDEWPLIESRVTSQELVFRSVDPGATLEVVEDVESIDRTDDSAFRDLIGASGERKFPVSHPESLVYAKLDGTRSVRDIVESVNLYEFDVCKSIYDMAERGLIIEAAPAAPAALAAPVRDVRPGVVRALTVVLLVWLVGAVATMHRSPLAFWGVPATAAMKVESFRAVRMRLDLERIGLALEAYHVRHGRYPAALRDLVSEKLLEERRLVGLDGAPVQYATTGEGFSLSFGGHKSTRASN